MESRTFQVLEFPKILGALSGFAVSEPGASACLEVCPFKTLDAVNRASVLFEQAAAWVNESSYKFNSFPPLDGLFPHLDNPNGVLDQDALFALKAVLDITRDARDSLKKYEDREWTVLVETLFAYDWPEKTEIGRASWRERV